MIRQRNAKKFGLELDQKTLNDRKELFYEKNYARIGVNTNDDLPLNKQLKFLTLTIIIRCVFEESGMLQYDRIDVSEGIGINKISESKDFMLCHYWYLKRLAINFNHIFVMVVMLCQ